MKKEKRNRRGRKGEPINTRVEKENRNRKNRMKGRIRFILKISYAIKLTRKPRVRFVYTLRARLDV